MAGLKWDITYFKYLFLNDATINSEVFLKLKKSQLFTLFLGANFPE